MWTEINQIRRIVIGASASGTKLGLQARTDPTVENAQVGFVCNLPAL